MNKRTKKKVTNLIWSLIAILIIISGSYLMNSSLNNEESISNLNEITYKQEVVNLENGDLLKVHFIDVGQADAIVITQGEHSMIIDAGTNKAGNNVVQYIKDLGITKFDYIIGTHAHEDHIGGMDDVINTFDGDIILFPKVTATTRTYENFITAIKSKNKKITTPIVGNKYELGKANFEILAPNSSEYDEANNYSIVIKLTFGSRTFLFTGDAQSESENEMLEKGLDLRADVIKIGHHGSKTSTTQEFLDAVKPKFAVISVGKDNDYSLPRKVVMNRIKKLKIPVYRTDESGTIIAISDGTNISFNKSPGTYSYMK